MTTDTERLSGSHNQHARLSPSDSKRWTSCLASIAFQEANAHRVRKDTSTRDSDFGTEAHDWAAKVLLKQITIEEVPDEFRESIVEPYVNHCMAQVDGATLTSVAGCREDADLGLDPPDHVFFVEEQLQLFYQPEQTGTADFLGIVATNGVVDKFVGRDLKAGAGVLVTSIESTQLACYIYSAIKLLEGVYDFGPETLIDLAVFQPRHREAHEQKPWILTLADLAKFCTWEIEMKAIAAREGANKIREKIGSPGRDVSCDEILEAAPILRFAPSEGDGGACRFCRCRAFCSKRLEALTEDMDLPEISAFDMLAAMPELDKEESKLPVEERINSRAERLGAWRLDDAYLVNAFAKASGIRKWLDDVAEYLEARVMDGESIPGVKLAEGRPGNREWANEDEADAWLQNQKLKQEERYDFKLKGPAKIEAILKDKLKKVTRTRNRFEELITRSTGKPKLVVSDDPRPAVTRTDGFEDETCPADDFEV